MCASVTLLASSTKSVGDPVGFLELAERRTQGNSSDFGGSEPIESFREHSCVVVEALGGALGEEPRFCGGISRGRAAGVPGARSVHSVCTQGVCRGPGGGYPEAGEVPARRRWTWTQRIAKSALEHLADRTGLTFSVSHPSPGTSECQLADGSHRQVAGWGHLQPGGREERGGRGEQEARGASQARIVRSSGRDPRARSARGRRAGPWWA